MAKISKKRLEKLERILFKLQEANKFLYSDDIVVCSKTRKKTAAYDFTNDLDDLVLQRMEKTIGSKLVFFHDIAKDLEQSLLELKR